MTTTSSHLSTPTETGGEHSDEFVRGFEAAKARFAASLRARAVDAGEEADDMAKRQNFQGMSSMERLEEFLLECATEVDAMESSDARDR